MSMTPEKLKALFGDLGKATMRGVRKCPKCGTLNGTRGVSCKNKNCNVVFKEKEKKKVQSAEAVKIVTGSTVQVFSIRLRDRGPDYRGFVQLPMVQDMDGNPAENVDPSILAQAARCYVDSCNRGGTSSQPTACAHVKAAIACEREADPLTLKNSVLNSLQVTAEVRQAIWHLATETTGPLVQRVSKNMMVVKCKPQPKHPLGLLHFSFFETSRNRPEPEYKFQCTCKAFKQYKPNVLKEDQPPKRCVHYYACICAFASDEKLSEEFMHYIVNENLSIPGQELVTIITTSEDEQIISTVMPAETTISAADQEIDGETTNVEVIIDDEGLLMGPEPKRQKLNESVEATTVILGGTDTLAQASSALLTLQESTATAVTHTPVVTPASPKKVTPVKQTSLLKMAPATTSATPKKIPCYTNSPCAHGPGSYTSKCHVTGNKCPEKVGPVEESQVTVSFHQWLASVTERINQTMHYQFDGSPDPLVFHASQKFFDCMQQRISAGNKKKRLPNSTTGFVRKDALPLGTFTKYTWHITNILHVKQIFDTPDMPLEITRSFVENRDNTYDLYEGPSRAHVENMDFSGQKQTPIRPFELKTYLKVGNTAPDQKEPTPFIIEWIPDILPKSKIGELRIKFEYGHQRNGQIEHRASVHTPETIEIQPVLS